MSEFTITDGLSIFQAVANLVPILIGIAQKYRDGNITAEQAQAEARAAFSKMMALMIDPQKDAATIDAAVDAAATEKFKSPQ